MSDLMKSNLYRFFKQPSTWVFFVCTLINSAFACFSCGILFGDAPWIEEYYKSASALMQERGIDFEGLMSSVTLDVASVFEFTAFGMFASVGLLLNPAVLMILFVIAYIIREKTFGFVRNLIPAHTKSRIEAGHLLMILIYSGAVTLISALTGIVLSGFFYSGPIPAGSFLRFAVFLLIETALLAVLGIFILTLTDAFRRPFFGGLLALVYFTLGAALFYGILDSIFSGFAGRQVDLSVYLPYGCMTSIVYSDNGSLMRTAAVALVSGVLLVLFRFYMVKNKELKDTI